MTTRITQQQLESYLWGAAVLLRGTIDAGDYKQFIFPLLFYKRLCDVFDEETEQALAASDGDDEFAAYPENHRFQVPAHAHWQTVRQVASNVGQALQVAMREIEKANPDKLFGIFGDAQWTNKDRLSDAMLRDLVEHFSSLELTLANLPEDELGQGYEYLIKKFADDSGHTAAEFYTNRTVVHLMTEMLEPQPGESIYDPTCGSGGMLLSTIARLREAGKEWRNVRLYGQERNLMTSSIARMNCFLHGIEDFEIVRGDTLAEPKLVHGDRLMQFDVVLANPPYSIKQWDRESFASDPWGRNLYGTPPQGRADYAFWQHILCSLKPRSGRCAILFPHGVLFRQEEAEMRRKLIEADGIECVLGLGPNLFYNSPMEACVVICRADKPVARQGRILFINAVNEVTRERAQSFLTDDHIERVVGAYRAFKEEPGFTRVATIKEICARDGSLSIALWVEPLTTNGTLDDRGPESLSKAIDGWIAARSDVAKALATILPAELSAALDTRLYATGSSELLKGKAMWSRVRFGDVVTNVAEAESNPAEAGLERFIGLEHLEPGSLHVRAWGNVAEGTTFTRRCRPGQVLFGKRRAYQRKVAVAEFDAVVSGDIYVFAPKNDRLLSELLPFLCLSERFFQYAVGTSAGSLSPRTNWTSLASYEFDLPPLDQQRRIAEILWAVDISNEHAIGIANNADQVELIALKDAFSVMFHDPRWQTCLLEDLGELQIGQQKSPKFTKGICPYPYLRVGNVSDGRLRLDSVEEMDFTDVALRKYRLRYGDILLTEGDLVSAANVGRSAMFYSEIEDCGYQNHLIRLRCRETVVPDFALQLLRYLFHTGVFARAAKRTTVISLGVGRVAKIPAALPPHDLQEQIAEKMRRFEKIRLNTASYVEAGRILTSTLVSSLLRP